MAKSKRIYPDVRHRLKMPIKTLWLLVAKLSYPRFYEKIAGFSECSPDLAMDIQMASNRQILKGDLLPKVWPNCRHKT